MAMECHLIGARQKLTNMRKRLKRSEETKYTVGRLEKEIR